MSTTPLISILRPLGALVALIATLAAPSRADVYRQYVGSAGAGRIMHLSVIYSGRSVDGFFEFVADSPVQPAVQSLTGTLIGHTLSVNATDSDTGNVSLKVRATFDRSPTADDTVELKGRLIDMGGDEWPLDLRQVPFGPTVGAIVTKELKRHGDRRHEFDYEAKFPQITGVKYAAFNGAVRAAIASCSKENLTYFTSDVNLPIPGINPSNYFDITYTIQEFTPHFASIDFHLYLDTGAAHPNMNDVTFNYDLDNNQVVSLGDVFAAGASYLHEVAVRTIAVLAKNNDLEYDEIVRGASTSAANYGVWSLTRWGLTFTFNAYQVGAYAVGPQQVWFPLKSLDLSSRADRLLAER